MKIPINWLNELVNLNCTIKELVSLLSLRTIGTKEVTEDFIELDMKGYNRADLLSMRGIAYEVVAITDSKLLFEELDESEFVWNKQDLLEFDVKVENPELCSLYTLAKIEGLKVKPSPKDWVEKLNESEIRSINNVADITNLIMLEYGQPLHSFDAQKVADGKIIIRTAKSGEKIKTLDGKLRKLTTDDLLITDPQKPIGIAGVMGGENTEATNNTNTILLEAAIFDPVNIRKTATRLGLSSEASKRFQHGLSKKRLLQSLDAAIKMYENIGGKVTAITIIGNLEENIRKITLTQQKLEDLVGIKFEDKQVEDYLKKLLLKPYVSSHSHLRGRNEWQVEVSYFRLDVNIEEDLIEEVARMYGYEKIPPAEVSQSKPMQIEDPIFQKISNLRSKLVETGLTEVQTYSFYSQDVLNALGFDDENKKVLAEISNPISAECEYLRMNLWPNLIEVVGKNLRKGFKDIAIFEIGKAFEKDKDGNPEEKYRLSMALSNNTDNPLAELYNIAEGLCVNLPGCKLNISEPEGIGKTLFHPRRFVIVEKEGKQTGGLAEIHLRILNKLGVEKRVAILEINI